ncbi:MAG: XdhC family protein [Bryobacteraceae bacterium]
MDELGAILEAWREFRGPDREAVLATVVHVTGSAYRRPGARMLLVPDGRRIGTVSGGCLEGDIARKAWWFTGSGEPVVKVYDTTSDDEAVWEFGLGCNGVVHVLLERIANPSSREMLEFLDRARRSAGNAVVATVVRCRPETIVRTGQRLLMRDGEPVGGDLAHSLAAAALSPHIRDAARTRQSCYVHPSEPGLAGAEVFVEFVPRPQDLVVFGAGHDAIPVVEMAAALGWRVTVADGRPDYATPQRFPRATRVTVVRPSDPLDGIAITPETAVVMMTHSYPFDRGVLPVVVARQPRYIGLLGPSARAERLLRETGIPRPASLYAPVGLDIGCETPAAIAVAIIAEIQAVVHGRRGGMLNGRSTSIHSPVLETGTPAAMRAADVARPAYCETLVGSHA